MIDPTATMNSRSVVIVSDLDHTMVQNEDLHHRRLLCFDHIWTTHGPSPPNLLVFSTGRSPTLFKELWQSAPLITPDVLICSVGTEVFYNAQSPVVKLLDPSYNTTDAGSSDVPGWVRFVPDKCWERFLDSDWSRTAVEELVARRFPQLTKQAQTEQRPHKLSFTLSSSGTPTGSTGASGSSGAGAAVGGGGGGGQADDVIQALRRELSEQGLAAKVVFSGGRDVDVLSPGAGKGCALSFVLDQIQRVGWRADTVLVNGDSGNDAELMEVAGVVGCVVGNAHEELRRHAEGMVAAGACHILQARNPCAAGIIEAMVHFGILPPRSPVLFEHECLARICEEPRVASFAVLDLVAVTCGAERDGADHGPETNAIPDAAVPAAPPGSTVIDGPAARELPESGPAIDAAVLTVARSHAADDVSDIGGPGDTAGLWRHAQQEGGASTASSGAERPRDSLTLDEGAREWAWRLGRALAAELGRGWLPTDRGSSIPPNSSLRLFVTNDCVVEPEPLAAKAHPARLGHILGRPLTSLEPCGAPAGDLGAVVEGGSGDISSGAGGGDFEPPRRSLSVVSEVSDTPADIEALELEGVTVGGDMSAASNVVEDLELADDLEAEGAAQSEDHDAVALAARAWIDQLRIQWADDAPAAALGGRQQSQGGSSGKAATGPAAGAGVEGALAGEGSGGVRHFTAEFKVCLLTASGMRSPSSWRCRVEGSSQQEPVPHGFLTHHMVVSAPLPPQATTVVFDTA